MACKCKKKRFLTLRKCKTRYLINGAGAGDSYLGKLIYIHVTKNIKKNSKIITDINSFKKKHNILEQM